MLYLFSRNLETINADACPPPIRAWTRVPHEGPFSVGSERSRFAKRPVCEGSLVQLAHGLFAHPRHGRFGVGPRATTSSCEPSATAAHSSSTPQRNEGTPRLAEPGSTPASVFEGAPVPNRATARCRGLRQSRSRCSAEAGELTECPMRAGIGSKARRAFPCSAHRPTSSKESSPSRNPGTARLGASRPHQNGRHLRPRSRKILARS